MAILTVSETKVFLQIASSDTSKDALIAVLIPEIEGQIKEYCNNTFIDQSTLAVVWPAGIKPPAAKMIGFTMSDTAGGGGSIGMQSESQGGYSYSKGSVDSEYPKSILKTLDMWRSAGIHFSSLQTQANDRRGFSVEDLADDESLDGVDGIPYANQ